MDQAETKKENQLLKKLEPLLWFFGRTITYIVVWVILNSWLNPDTANVSLGMLTFNQLLSTVSFYIASIWLIVKYSNGFSKYSDTKEMWSSVGYLAIIGVVVLVGYVYSSENPQNKYPQTVVPANSGFQNVAKDTLEKTPEPAKTKMEPNQIPVQVMKVNNGFALKIPNTISSTCVWNYNGGSAVIPYTKTTHVDDSTAFHYLILDGDYYDFKVSCADSFGNSYGGIFPQ
ncbi:MAG: hypothetical protein WCO12_01360 [bacterium]